jgi:VCBS repeat-containing protein
VDTLVVATETGLTQPVTVIIEGTDDVAVVSGQASGEIDTARSGVVTGLLSIHDADNSDNPIWLFDQPATPGENGFGVFSILDNQWTYQLNSKHSQVLEMKAGDFLNDGFWVSASDDSRYWVSIRIENSVVEPELLGALPVLTEPVITPSAPLITTLPTVEISITESIESTSQESVHAPTEDTPDSNKSQPANVETELPELQPISVELDISILSKPSSTHSNTAKDNVVLIDDDNDSDQGNTTGEVRKLKLNWDQDRLENELNISEFSKSKLDRNIQEMAEQFDDAESREIASHTFAAQVSAGVGLTIAAGYVTWAMQAGSMLASLFASMPVWRQFDPLPILANKSTAVMSVDDSDGDENKSEEEKQLSMDKNANELLD